MSEYDVIIIGSGPAGASAALYTVRAGLKTLLLSTGVGALAKAELIENYYGLEKPISGMELHERGEKQAVSLGAELKRGEVVSVEYFDLYTVSTADTSYVSKALILATGAARKTPKIKGIDVFEGKGISYCAVCDAFFYRSKPVAVLGNGEFALHEAEELSHVTDNVTIITNGSEMKAKNDKFPVITDKITEINGETNVNAVMFESGKELAVKGVFVALGVAGSTDIARKLGAVVTDGKISVDTHGKTTVPGLFAAGDTTGGLLQISKAVSDGALAAVEAIAYVRKKR